MLFILSKILEFFIFPLTWVFATLLYALFAKNPKRKKIAVIVSVSILFLFSNSFIFDEVMRAWEVKTISKSQIKEPYEYGILLGGMVSFDSKNDRINFVRSVDRMMQALELYKQNKIRKILITSGTGSLKEPDMKEAEILKNYLVRIGFPTEDIITESASRNTYENAVFTSKLLPDKKREYLLITSAFHMRRSMGCFKKLGFKVVPYVADRYSGPRKFYLDHLLLPNIHTLSGWNMLLHEWVGYVAYNVAGYL